MSAKTSNAQLTLDDCKTVFQRSPTKAPCWGAIGGSLGAYEFNFVLYFTFRVSNQVQVVQTSSNRAKHDPQAAIPLSKDGWTNKESVFSTGDC